MAELKFSHFLLKLSKQNEKYHSKTERKKSCKTTSAYLRFSVIATNKIIILRKRIEISFAIGKKVFLFFFTFAIIMIMCIIQEKLKMCIKQKIQNKNKLLNLNRMQMDFCFNNMIKSTPNVKKN